MFIKSDSGFYSEKGLTLIEMMVAITVTSILAGVVMVVVQQTMSSMSQHQARSQLVSKLASAGQQIANDLRSQGRKATQSQASYQLRGIDGDGKFEKLTTSDTKTNLSNKDRLHFHARFTNSGSSKRHLFCYFLSPGDQEYLQGKDSNSGSVWGIIKRDGDLDWNVNNYPEHNDYAKSAPLASNIDYLSFHYYKKGCEAGPWVNEWHSHDNSYDCVNYDATTPAGDYPDAIEFAIRAYDPTGRMSPEWYISTVSITRNTP